MKRILSTILSVALLVSALSVSAFAADEKTKTFHFGSEKQAVETQGENGWYYVYSEEYNKGDKFDVDDFKECEWSSNTAYAAWGGEFWCPTDYDSAVEGDKWFIINDEGKVLGAGNRTAAVKWVAPYDGAFSVKAKVDAGLSDAFYSDVETYGVTWSEKEDGVNCLIFKDYDLLAEHRTGEEWGWWDYPLGSNENWWEGWGLKDGGEKHAVYDYGTMPVQMKKGEALYFITDNKAYANYDFAQWDIEISYMAEAMYSFGNNDTIEEEQGVNGWYYMYSKEINKGDNISLDSFKECAYPGVPNGIMMWGGSAWTPDIEESELPEGFITEDGNSFWWGQYANSGDVIPDGNMSAAIKWVVPVSGKYDMTVLAKGGYSDSYKRYVVDEGLEADVPNDGVYASVYYNGERIFSKDFTGAPTTETALDKEMELKEGDVFYFIMDQKALAGKGYDTGNYNITALLLEKAAEPTNPETPTTPTEPSNPTNPTKPVTPTGVPNVVPVLLVLGGLAAGVLLVSKKRKA